MLRDQELCGHYRAILTFTKEQLRLVQARHDFGDTTIADIGQARVRVADAAIKSAIAGTRLAESAAIYRQLTGAEPVALVAPAPLDHIALPTLEQATAVALRAHPAILAALYQADAAKSSIKVAQSDFFPKVGVTASVNRRFDALTAGDRQTTGSITGQVSMPLFDGGTTASKVRQAREVFGQRQLEADAARERVRATVAARWSLFQAAKTQTLAARYGAEAISAKSDRVTTSFALSEALGVMTLNAIPSQVAGRNSPQSEYRFFCACKSQAARAFAETLPIARVTVPMRCLRGRCARLGSEAATPFRGGCATSTWHRNSCLSCKRPQMERLRPAVPRVVLARFIQPACCINRVFIG